MKSLFFASAVCAALFAGVVLAQSDMDRVLHGTAASDRYQILNGNTVPPAAEEPSFVEWMRGVEKELGQRKSNLVIGFVATAGLHTLMQGAKERSWPDDCDAGPDQFCPRRDWERELVFLFQRTSDRVEAIAKLWCEDPARGGSLRKLPRRSGRDGYFCEVNGMATAALIPTPDAPFQWWAIEPAKLDEGFEGYQAAFRTHGFRSRAVVDADVAAQRLALQRQEEERYRLETERLENKRVHDVPKMRQIGTRLCRDHSDKQLESTIRFVGFTEGVSPDNGKIQIRVVEAQVINAPNLRPGGFQPHITWDDPMNWELCE